MYNLGLAWCTLGPYDAASSQWQHTIDQASTLHATLEALLEALHMSPTIFTPPPLRRPPSP